MTTPGDGCVPFPILRLVVFLAMDIPLSEKFSLTKSIEVLRFRTDFRSKLAIKFISQTTLSTYLTEICLFVQEDQMWRIFP